MTPMNNAEYLTRLKYADEFEKLRAAKKEKGFMWIASVFDGQQYVPEEYAKKLAALLDLPADSLAFLTEHPYKGNTNPILYRLHEVIDTYGPAIKAIIHEEGGNAIMSAIDFGLDVEVITDDAGNHRVIIKMDGKLLPYAKKGTYPW